MKKFLVSVAAAALCSGSAFAATLTISFASDDGETQVWNFDSSTNTATTGDLSVPYTWDAEAKSLCAQLDSGELCATFEKVSETPAVNDTTRYTTSAGGAGTATITGLAE